MRALVLVVLMGLVGGCSALGEMVPIFNTEGEQVGEAEVGDLLAGSGIVDTVGTLVGGAAGNPMLGAAAAAALGGLILGRKRKKKPKS